jgi:hypothetical protein
MAARWSTRELTTLSKNLVDGFLVQRMMTLIPNRSDGAIKLKSQGFGFGVKTSNEDGATRFYTNIKSRVRHANALADIDEINSIVSDIEVAQPNATVSSNSIDNLEPAAHIITYDGLSANTLAVRMLTEHNISINPDIVYMLSLHILKGHL